MIRKIIPFALLAAMVATTGCAEGNTDKAAAKPTPAAPTDAVAIVNGESISRDVWNIYVKSRTKGASPDTLTDEQKKEDLNGLIEMYLAAQQARKEGLDKGEDGARLQLMQTGFLAQLAGRKLIEGQQPTEDEMKAEYAKQVAAMPKLEYKARHILVDSEAKANELIAKLKGGANFEKLAEENSTDPSGKQGGDLGWFSPNRMVKPFAEAVEKLKKGEFTTTPVHTQFGWHVIQLEDTKPVTPPSYDAVKQQLAQMVNQSKFQEYLEGLMKTAKIERKL